MVDEGLMVDSLGMRALRKYFREASQSHVRRSKELNQLLG